MTISADELNKSTSICMKAALEAEGVTSESLAKVTKKHLRAKETKIIQLDGTYRGIDEIILALSGGELDEVMLKKLKRIVKNGPVRILGASREKTLLAIDVENLGIQHAAKSDAHKLRGDYPAVTKKLQFDEATLNAILRGLPAEFGKAVSTELAAALSAKRD